MNTRHVYECQLKTCIGQAACGPQPQPPRRQTAWAAERRVCGVRVFRFQFQLPSKNSSKA